MPHSDSATYPFMLKAIEKSLKVQAGNLYRILDCGIGSGDLGKAIKDKFSDAVELYGLEVHEPYITDPKDIQPVYHNLYSWILAGDQANYAHFLANTIQQYECIIFGDSLEHVKQQWAEHSLYHALRLANLVIVNAPIVPYPQGPQLGNPWEEHHWTPTKKILKGWGGKYMGGNEIVGCFVWEGGLEGIKNPPKPIEEQK